MIRDDQFFRFDVIYDWRKSQEAGETGERSD